MESSKMNRQRIRALGCHAAACLLFPVGAILGFQISARWFGSPFAKGIAIGLAVQLIFIAFILANILIALVSSMETKAVLSCVLAAAVLIYLLPEHPLRGLFFAGLSGCLSLAAIYASRKLAQMGKNT